MKALQEEMVDTEGVAEEELEKYTDTESTGTSLGSLLAGFHASVFLPRIFVIHC